MDAHGERLARLEEQMKRTAADTADHGRRLHALEEIGLRSTGERTARTSGWRILAAVCGLAVTVANVVVPLLHAQG